MPGRGFIPPNNMKLDIILEGEKELLDTFNRVNGSVARDVLAPILLDGAKEFKGKLEPALPTGPTGRLKRSAKAKLMDRNRGEQSVAIAAIDRSIAPHAHLVESGHGGRTAPAHPYFKPTFDSQAGPIFEGITNKITKNIEDSFK